MIELTVKRMGDVTACRVKALGSTTDILGELVTINAEIFKKILPSVKDGKLEELAINIMKLALKEMEEGTSIGISLKKEG